MFFFSSIQFFFLHFFFFQIKSTCENNLLTNADFSLGLLNWTHFGGGTESIVVEALSNNVLEVVNSGSNAGVYQQIDFESCTDKAFYFELDVKPNTYTGGAGYVGMDIFIEFEDGSDTWYVSDILFTGDDTVNVWNHKWVYYYPDKRVCSMRVLLLNYQPSSVRYDNLCASMIDRTYDFDTGHGILGITKKGRVNYLVEVEGGGSILERETGLIEIYIVGDTYNSIIAMVRDDVDPDLYELFFRNTNIKMKMRLYVEPGLLGVFNVEIESVTNPDSEVITMIQFFRMDLIQWKEDVDWLKTTVPTSFITHILPTDDSTTAQHGSVTRCRTVDFLTDGKCAVVMGKKNVILSNTEEFIKQSNGALPYMKVNGVQWLRKKTLRESYLFATITHTNYNELLNISKVGKFPMFLAITPLRAGLYNTPNSFDGNTTWFYEAMRQFTSNGIKIGIHTFMCRVHFGDPLYNTANLFKQHVGDLTGAIDSTQTTINVNAVITNNAEYIYFSSKQTSTYTKYKFAIGNEIVYCDVSGSTLSNCDRGSSSTTAAAHGSSTSVHYLVSTYGGFFLDYNNAAVIQQSYDGFASLANDLNVSYIYADGAVLLQPEDISGDISGDYQRKKCMYPYIKQFNNLEYVQYGGMGSTYDYYYTVRVASFDGVVFKNKDFTKNHKLNAVLEDPEPLFADREYREFGWWKIHGSSLGSGRNDYDSTTMDDVHYVMSKVFLTERSLGMQLSTYYGNHARMYDLIEVIGRYHDLIQREFDEGDVIERTFKDTYKLPEYDVELTTENNFIEKKVHKFYTNENSFSAVVSNPYYGQYIKKMEIRPKPSYYTDYNDARHVLISDFSSSSSYSVSGSSGLVCNLLDNGVLSIVNNNADDEFVYCSIDIAGSTVFDLTHKRGIGIDLTGDNSNVLVNIHLTVPGTGKRDFIVPINFIGRQQFLLGDPTTQVYEEINGIRSSSGLGYSRTGRSWNFDWKTATVRIFMFVHKGASANIQFHSVKGLQENSNIVKNPTITSGCCSVTFPVTLYLNDDDPYIFEYNNFESKYKFYTSNQLLLNESNFDTSTFYDCLYFYSGNSNIVISSDVGEELSNRMEVLITLYGNTFYTYFNRPDLTFLWVILITLAVLILLLIPIILITPLVVFLIFWIKKRQDNKNEMGESFEMK